MSFLEPSTIVTAEEHNCLTTVYNRYGSLRLGAADQVNLASDWLI